MSTSSNNSSGGVGILGLLGIAFVVLKLCGVIDWSWWLVTLPFWGGLALLLGIAIMAGVVYLIASAFGVTPKQRRRRR